MTTTTTATGYDPAALYTKWTDAAEDIVRRYSSASVSEVGSSHVAARAWMDGAANLYVAENLAAYLIEQMQLDSSAAVARATYADMLNDLHVSRTEVAELRAHAARLEAELAELRTSLEADATSESR